MTQRRYDPWSDSGEVVYFAKDRVSGLVKIGCTSNLTRRLRQLRNNWPTELARPDLEVLGWFKGDTRSERAAHARLDHLRVANFTSRNLRELFIDGPDLRALVSSACLGWMVSGLSEDPPKEPSPKQSSRSADPPNRCDFGASTIANDTVALRFIKEWIEEHGSSPSIRELRKCLGYRSNNGVLGALKRLEERGAIERIPGQPNGIRMVTPLITDRHDQEAA